MDDLQSSTPIRPLHVEIDGIAKYRQASSVQDLAGFLLSERWPHLENDPGPFHRALATAMEAMQLYLDPEIARKAFVEAAHASKMHILPDDMDETKAGGRSMTKAPPKRGSWRSSHRRKMHPVR